MPSKFEKNKKILKHTKSYWLDTKWGCGLVTVNQLGMVIDPVAPIFKMLRTQPFWDIIKRGDYFYREM